MTTSTPASTPSTWPQDFLLGLATNLAYDLVKAGSVRLRDLAFGDAETRALERAWDAAFAALLAHLSPVLSSLKADTVEDVLRAFVRDSEVAGWLLALGLAGEEPPLLLLRAQFEVLQFNGATLSADFNSAMAALVQGLTGGLLDEAAQPGSPLFNRVSVVRTAAIHALLREHTGALQNIYASVAQMERQLAQLGEPGQPLHPAYMGPASGFIVMQEQMDRLDANMRRLLTHSLETLNRQAAQHAPSAPYDKADRRAYLRAVVADCATLYLPYAQDGGASLLLENVYVSLKADRSSPVEREASARLFERQASEAAKGGMDEEILYQVARLNPYAARFWLHDPRLHDRLMAAAREDRERTFHLAEIVRRERWIVLLGDPGSGKSTLGRWLALTLAKAMQQDQETVSVPADQVRPDAKTDDLPEPLGPARLPVLIRLADYAAARWPQPGQDTSLSLHTYLGRHLKAAIPANQTSDRLFALLDDYLTAGRATLILDGLDEVTVVTQRQAIAGEIETLIRAHVRDDLGRCPLDSDYIAPLDQADADRTQGNQVIVTSRIVGYQIRPLAGSLPHYVIQPMDDVAVTRFCANWTQANSMAEQADALAQAVLKHPNPNVSGQMARNPLLLTILAQVFQEEPEQGLPARRAALYGQAEATVFDQRNDQWGRLSQQMGGEDLAPALRRITALVAHELHANPDHPAALANRAVVEEWLIQALADEPALTPGRRPRDVARSLLAAAGNLSGFFVARGQEVYGFLHRQFQEYFAARYLVDQAADTAYLDWTPLTRHMGDPAWREVLLLAVGLLPRPQAEKLLSQILLQDDRLAQLLGHHLLFVAAALDEMAQPPYLLVYRVAQDLIRLYRREDKDRFAALEKRVAQAFDRLPRQVEGQDPVGDALYAALVGPPKGMASVVDPEADGGKLTRLAACELVQRTEWYSQPVCNGLIAAWSRHSSPTASILDVLSTIYKVQKTLFAQSNLALPMRHFLHRQPSYFNRIGESKHWQRIFEMLYVVPAGPLVVAAIVRDSPLTPILTELLQSDAKAKQISEALQIFVAQAKSDGVLWRDLCLCFGVLEAHECLRSLIDAGEKDWRAGLLSSITIIHGRCQIEAMRVATTLEHERSELHEAIRSHLQDLKARVDHVTNSIGRAKSERSPFQRQLDYTNQKLSSIWTESLDYSKLDERAFKLRLTLRDYDHSISTLYSNQQALEMDLKLCGILERITDFSMLNDPTFMKKVDLSPSFIIDLNPMMSFEQVAGLGLNQALQDFLMLSQQRIESFEHEYNVSTSSFENQELWSVFGRLLSKLSNCLKDFNLKWSQAWSSRVNVIRETAQSIMDRLDDNSQWAPLSRPQLTLARLETIVKSSYVDYVFYDQEWSDFLSRLDTQSLAHPLEQNSAQILSILQEWIDAPPSSQPNLFSQHSSLLIGEFDIITPDSLPHLLTCLMSRKDLTRYRAIKVLTRERLASTWGRKSIEFLAIRHKELDKDEREFFPLINTCIDWALCEVKHDEATWLSSWAEAGQTVILSRINQLRDDCWDSFFGLLKSGSPDVKVSLLGSVARLWQLERIPIQQQSLLIDLCFSIFHLQNESCKHAALNALKYIPQPEPEIIIAIMDAMDVGSEAACAVLAHHGVHWSEDERKSAWSHLREYGDEAYSALVYQTIVTSQLESDLQESSMILPILQNEIPDSTALLTALLAAGADDDPWKPYHDTVVAVVAELAQSAEGLLVALLQKLDQALTGEAWPAKRMTLAGVAACAAVMPDALNQAMPAHDLETLLVRACRVADSFTARHRAITALGHLRTVTPRGLQALLDASRDLSVVQQNAVEAAGLFQRFSPWFSHDQALVPLAEALAGESGASALVAARLLAAVATAPSALEVAGLRDRITQVLVNALDGPHVREEVWLLEEDGSFNAHGTVYKAILDALIQVVGVPE